MKMNIGIPPMLSRPIFLILLRNLLTARLESGKFSEKMPSGESHAEDALNEENSQVGEQGVLPVHSVSACHRRPVFEVHQCVGV